MVNQDHSIEPLLDSLRERAKELNCLYKIEEALAQPEAEISEICAEVVNSIPPGWRFPDLCRAKVQIGERSCQSDGFTETDWIIHADIQVMGKVEGMVQVVYLEAVPQGPCGAFLEEEERLIKAIADRLGHFLVYRKMKAFTLELQRAEGNAARETKPEWQVVLELLQQTDRNLYTRISHKMLNLLCWSGIQGATELMVEAGYHERSRENEMLRDTNRPHQKSQVLLTSQLSTKVFDIAKQHVSDNVLLARVRKWILDDRLSFLAKALENQYLPISAVADALRRYMEMSPDGTTFSGPTQKSVKVSLIRRFFTEQLQYINIAKHFVEVRDFCELQNHIISPADSHGKLGGKSAGLFLAERILRFKVKDQDLLNNLRVPKSYYITSDAMLHFVHYNNLDEVVEQKYKEINQIRLEYPNIVQTFKNSPFPPDIVNGLSRALDDFENCPLIVRSSSLLEDRIGAAFSGKYKSLFIANQGGKEERLDALMDAIAEVYASTFGPDPIEYRAERELLDFHEEMGILIQEVVGQRTGDYFFPAYAGVAFSHNEFRWSPRIRREDGLIRLVPGLGTRAVDRTSDDYPILIAPGQPSLRVNVSPDEIIRYSPKMVDVINLRNNTFETVNLRELIRRVEWEYPKVKQIFSIHKEGLLQQPVGFNIDFDRDDLLPTFDSLISKSPFVERLHTILKTLEEHFERPVDIEFASDGTHFYLLQCRPQSSGDAGGAAPIPKEIPEERLIFSAKKYISNGRVPDITHIVYVDGDRYGK
ncbi:PEP/pyruvate-binding domain-containing protein, partial [bacterium]|nr:PEP/pyruvate-binding domain-containing protein [candidate division CSSED10-310 bacterium]